MEISTFKWPSFGGAYTMSYEAFYFLTYTLFLINSERLAVNGKADDLPLE